MADGTRTPCCSKKPAARSSSGGSTAAPGSRARRHRQSRAGLASEGDSAPTARQRRSAVAERGQRHLFQQDSGEAFVWATNGTALTGGGNLGNPGPDWHEKASAISTATAAPTFCGRTTTATSRSGRPTGPMSSPAPVSAIPGRAGISLGSAISTATAVPTSCGRTAAAKRSSGCSTASM